MTTSACGCEPAGPVAGPDESASWWRNGAVLIPVFSGLTLLLGVILEWLANGPGAETAAAWLFWTALLLGASQFVPGAVRGLLVRGRLSIGLLMTISARPPKYRKSPAAGYTLREVPPTISTSACAMARMDLESTC